MTPPLKITAVKDHEIDLLRDVAVVTFIDTYKAHNEPEPFEAYLARNFSKAELLKQYKTAQSSFFFAWFGDDIAGYLKLNSGAAQTDDVLSRAMEIERIYVRQEFKGKAIGKALIQKAVSVGQEAGLDWIWLGVWDQNAHAIEFYKRQGFEVFDTHNFMMGDVAQNDFLMKLRLS